LPNGARISSDDPTVVRDLTQHLLGRSLNALGLAKLFAIPPGVEAKVEVEEGKLVITMEHPSFAQPREISLEKRDAQLVAEVRNSVWVEPGQGKELPIFARLVDGLTAYGVDRIELKAADVFPKDYRPQGRPRPPTGPTVWPDYGFDATLSPKQAARIKGFEHV